jgi:adenosylcobinamide-GDP ribazoletransferase
MSPIHIDEPTSNPSASPLAAFFSALEFLTLFPPLLQRVFSPAELGQAVGFYPLVGLLLGAFLAGAEVIFDHLLPGGVSLALLLAVWVVSTGALHLDGFLDSCDGLFGGQTPQERLEIMRDERLGAFALAGGLLLILCKFASLNAIPNLYTVLLVAPTLGRWGMAFALVFFPYGREQGIGRDIKDNAGTGELVVATLTAVLVALFAGWGRGVVALLAVGALAWAIGRFSLRRLPGLTGDIYGAINELGELLVLLIFAIR